MNGTFQMRTNNWKHLTSKIQATENYAMFVNSCLLPFQGISLNPEQWSQLKDQISEIDDAVKRI